MNSKKALKYLLVAATGIVAAASPSFAEVVYSQVFDGSADLTNVVIAPGVDGNDGGFSQRSWGGYYGIGSLPLGWSISCAGNGGCGVLAFVGSTSGTETDFGFDGQTGILLNEEPGSANSISTTITGLNAGQTYTLSFDYWGDNNPDPTDGTAYPFNAIVDGNATPFTGDDVGPPPSGTYSTANLSFVAVGGSDTLAFVETTVAPDGSSVILDNVKISDTPEPGTFGMLFLASGALAWGWNKRSRRA